jgi:hypothetical protein
VIVRPQRYALRGAWTKVENAERHLEQFEKLFQEFARSVSFARIVHPGEDLPDALDDGFGPDDVWDELSCNVGDCVHNLRCALDHAAYAVAQTRGLPEPRLEKVYFTIRETKAKFDDVVHRKNSLETEIGADWVAFLESLQPFTDARYADLGRIMWLDNVDKHRVILSLKPRSDVFVHRPGKEPERWTADIEHGRVRMPADTPGVMMASSYLVFDDVPAGTTARPVEIDLLDFYSLVQDVLRNVGANFF